MNSFSVIISIISLLPALSFKLINPPVCNKSLSFCKMSTAEAIVNGVIIGGGRVGSFLYESNNKRDILFTDRNDHASSEGSGPIYICTRNDDLENIIIKTQFSTIQ